MLYTTLTALLFPVAIMAVPAQKPAAHDGQCAPISYTITEYTRAINPGYGFVSFNVQSSYTVDSRVNDTVKGGVNCEADGTIIPPSSKQCNLNGKKVKDLVFMLRGKQDEEKYLIHHKWQCNNATWESINSFTLPPLDCNTVEDGRNGKTTRCSVKPFMLDPQNVQKLVDDKQVAGKVKTKPANCHNPSKCDA